MYKKRISVDKVVSGIVGLAIIVVAVGVLGGGCTCISNLTGASKKEAEVQARQWASEMGIEVKGVKCVGMDTDGDGYVSCSVNDGTQIHMIECTGAWTLNDGCRMPKATVRPQVNVRTQ